MTGNWLPFTLTTALPAVTRAFYAMDISIAIFPLQALRAYRTLSTTDRYVQHAITVGIKRVKTSYKTTESFLHISTIIRDSSKCRPNTMKYGENSCRRCLHKWKSVIKSSQRHAYHNQYSLFCRLHKKKCRSTPSLTKTSLHVHRTRLKKFYKSHPV